MSQTGERIYLKNNPGVYYTCLCA